MNIGDMFRSISASGEAPGPTQCLLLVSGHAMVVEKSEKKAFIEKANAEGFVVVDPEDRVISAIMQ